MVACQIGRIMKYPLNVYDHLDNIIQEADIQFLLSLSPKVPIVQANIADVFIEDKVGRQYYATRQLQLDTSLKQCDQIKLYEDIWIPARKRFVKEPPISKKYMDAIQDNIGDNLKNIVKLTGHYQDPRNPSGFSWLKSLYESDTISFRNLPSHIQSIMDFDLERVYEPSDDFTIQSIPIPQWNPDKRLLQREVLDSGYFTGPANQKFYVKELTTACAIEMFTLAKRSLLPGYQIILDQSLNPIHINQKYIYHMENK